MRSDLRHNFHLSLGTAPFEVDLRKDIIHDAQGKDPGIYTRAHELLRPYARTHAHGVIVLDNAWDGSPGAENIRTHISANMVRSGWREDRFAVIVINPELEAWIWQDNVHVEKALGYTSPPSLRLWLRDEGLWPDGLEKPPDPKEAVLRTMRVFRKKSFSVVFKQICLQVSLRSCTDPEFERLCSALHQWFPYKTE